MSKDDYFVVVYRVLKYFYECFKAGQYPEASVLSPDALGINPTYFVNVMQSLADDGYIKGVAFQHAIGASLGVKFVEPKITPAGIEFLQENTMMKKAIEALKTIKGVVPGF